MARLPDLVRDSKLETYFPPNSSVETVHTYHEPDPISGRRVVPRSEHWQRQKKIGGGAFGSVWLEKCTRGGRNIEVRAVKQIEIDRDMARIDYNGELEAIAKFSHPKYEKCFVKSLGWYESPENLFIAMEYVELGDLHSYLNRKPPLPEHEASEITYQILDGLNLMHDNEFAHRDLKPKNILLKSCPPNAWWVKIADFGISKRIEDRRGISTTLKGTLGYIAPELYGYTEKGSPYAVDIWAVGEIAFQMLTKQPTFKNLGLLWNYVQKPETFPSNLLLAAQASQLGLDLISSLMHPTPIDRITAEMALRHRWVERSLPYRRASATPAYEEAHTASAIDLMTEEFATWNTITSPKAPTAVSPRKSEEFGTFSLLSSSNEMVRFQPVQNTTSSSSDGKLLASGSEDKAVRIPEPPFEIPEPVFEACYRTGTARSILKGHSSLVSAVAFSPDGKLLASASEDKTVRLWDPATGIAHSILKGHSAWVSAVAFSPAGKLLASASRDCTVRLWNLATGTVHSILKGHGKDVIAVAFSPDGKLLASASVDETVRLWDPSASDDKTDLLWDLDSMIRRSARQWDPATGIVHILKGHSSSVNTVAFSPDGKLLASASHDKLVRLWDPATGIAHSILKGHSAWVSAVAFSPAGKLLASASRDCTVRLWNLATGTVHSILKGHGEHVTAVAFSPDGKLLASASDDKTVRLWDPPTGIAHSILKGHSSLVSAVAFSPDGKLLASASVDNTVRLWDPAM